MTSHPIGTTIVDEHLRAARAASAVRRYQQAFDWFAALGAATVTVVAAAVLAGWVFDIAWLTFVRPGLATMKANTALSFLVAGASAGLLLRPGRRSRVIGRAGGWLVVLIAAVTLIEYLGSSDYGIDQLLLRDTRTTSGFPGRMSPATAAGLLCLGLALVAFGRDDARAADTSTTLAAIAAGIAWIALTGYVYDVEALYRVGTFGSMAVHTAALLLLLGLAVVAAQSRSGLIAAATSDSAGGVFARRLIPLVPIGFLLAGALWLAGERRAYYSGSFALALTVVSTTVFSILIMARVAVLLHHTDLERRAAHAQMVAATTSSAHRRFEALLEAAPDAMVIVDANGTIVLVNAQTERLFGYRRDELLGQPVELLIPSRLRQHHVAHRASYAADPRSRAMGADQTLYGQRKDGTEFPVEVSLSPLRTDEGLLISSAVRDVTARRHAEATLRRSLDEKDTLLREVHHRVKNNLAVVSSLFYLESRSATTPESIRLLQEARARVQSMALVHETLYRSDNLAGLDFDAYLRVLVPPLVRTYTSDGRRVSVEVNADGIRLALDTAVPCALIINELVTNSLKHAFPDGRSGEVRVSLTEHDGTICLRVTDSGVGIPAAIDPVTARSLGLRLVRALTGQLGGQFSVRRTDRGSEAILVFPRQESA